MKQVSLPAKQGPHHHRNRFHRASCCTEPTPQTGFRDFEIRDALMRGVDLRFTVIQAAHRTGRDTQSTGNAALRVNDRLFPISPLDPLGRAAIRLFYSIVWAHTSACPAFNTPLRFDRKNGMPFAVNRLGRANPNARLTALTGQGDPVCHILPHDR